jgi:NitT/TauT family transport system substrate-binding protein
MRRFSGGIRVFLFSMVVIAALRPATLRAETNEVRIAEQFSLAFLQMNVMKTQKLVEKHAALLGMPNLKVTFQQFAATTAVNDALLSGATDFVAGGVPGLMLLWDRTWGTPQEVRAVSALGYFDLYLNSRAPHVKTIKDFKDTDKIAMSSVKISGQAIVLQMAAAKEWGADQWERLDKLTFAMAPADQAAGLLANNPSFESAFSSPPFTLMQLKNPTVKTVLKSSDVVGDATSAIWWSTKKFRDANPTVYKAVFNAVKEAQDLIEKDMRGMIGAFIEDSKTKATVDESVEMMKLPGFGFHIAPQGIMGYADFLNKTGRMKNKPASWKDLFFDEIHDMKGS